MPSKQKAHYKKTKLPRVVAIGGGHGTAVVLEGLRDYPVDVSAIVSMADDGGSSGILRRELGVLALGDVRRALVALAGDECRLLADIAEYRFTKGALAGHALGNLMLVALERMTGSFSKGLHAAHELFGVRGHVIPVTLESAELCAEYADGSVVRGEKNIDMPKRAIVPAIRRVWLEPNASPNPEALVAIRSADVIIFGPGDLYTSIVPNILVRGVAEAIKKSSAKKIMIVNYRTKRSETNGFSATDFVRELERYLGEGVLDVALCAITRVSPDRLAEMLREGGEPVSYADRGVSRAQLIIRSLLTTRGILRHDPKKLARAIMALLPAKQKNGNRRA
ncbi:MAG: YvcK family protein [bacterium]|nr:YvcK family protein [bacterium]MDZ4299957.1 gluconeogenesis factor YvcK family protein [Candidatus Sungbacteria bacterium]